MTTTEHVRVAIVGTGFSGLGLAIELMRSGYDDVVLLEKADDVGGTWRANIYPGCQCDVPSHLYSFSFAPNPDWSRTYSPQPEIWDYLRDCAHRFGITPRIRYGHEVTEARWDEDTNRWIIETTKGRLTADIFVLATGALSEPRFPEIPGLDGFEGAVFHSAEWDVDHDLSGERVAVVGTGASAIQIVPKIQPTVDRLHVFQRTPAWVLPHRDRPTTRFERTLYRRLPVLQRIVRAVVYWLRELLVFAMVRNPDRMGGVERLARKHLADQVPDAELRERLTPDYKPGCKRLLPSNDFYPALSKPNVDLVTEPIREVRPRSIVTADGTERPVDTIVLATGFMVTDNPMWDVVRGRNGGSLAKLWTESGAQAYLGTTVPGFPNLFLMTGPNTGIGHTSLLVMIEGQMRYIVDCLRTMDRHGVTAVEVKRGAFEAFNEDLHRKMQGTVWTSGGCASWYLDAQGRNSTLWPDFTWRYRLRTRRFDREHYEPIARSHR